MVITSTEAAIKPSASSINGVYGVNATVLSSELSPRKGGVGKPARRRSRASKKTPTTHLNADAANFRAVVQQFTGCHTAATFPRAHKGPINLNFGVHDDDGFDAVLETGYDGNGGGFHRNRCRKERRWLKKVEEERETINEVDDDDHRVLMSSTAASSTVSSDAALTLDDLDLEKIPFHDFIEDFSLMSEDWNDYLREAA